MEEFKFNTVEEAIAAIKAGKMVLVTDDEDRENEGDLIMAAELCTPEAPYPPITSILLRVFRRTNAHIR